MTLIVNMTIIQPDLKNFEHCRPLENNYLPGEKYKEAEQPY